MKNIKSLAAVLTVIAAPAAAQQAAPIDQPGPVVRLALADGIGTGIDSGAPGRVLAQTADGTWFSVTPDGLQPADPPAVRAHVPDLVPDGLVTAAGTMRAWLSGPTERYRHGILGDATEAGTLALQAGDAAPAQFDLPNDSVFEDLRVRLVDLSNDGTMEAVVVRSYADAGSALSVFALDGPTVRLVAETPPIGRSSRWLNPAGAADFDGDGAVEVAYVETPHIGGTLRLWQLTDDGLVQDFAVRGFSNHFIGSREQDLAAVIDWDGDGVADIALPDARRGTLRVVSFAGGEARELASIPNPAPIVTAVLSSDAGAGVPLLIYGLADGSLWQVSP